MGVSGYLVMVAGPWPVLPIVSSPTQMLRLILRAPLPNHSSFIHPTDRQRTTSVNLQYIRDTITIPVCPQVAVVVVPASLPNNASAAASSRWGAVTRASVALIAHCGMIMKDLAGLQQHLKHVRDPVAVAIRPSDSARLRAAVQDRLVAQAGQSSHLKAVWDAVTITVNPMHYVVCLAVPIDIDFHRCLLVRGWRWAHVLAALPMLVMGGGIGAMTAIVEAVFVLWRQNRTD